MLPSHLSCPADVDLHGVEVDVLLSDSEELGQVDQTVLARVRQARAEARERAWLAPAELGRALLAGAKGQ